MKKIILVFLILPIICFSQKLHPKNINTNLLDSITYNIISKTLAPSDIYLPFSGFEIIDARFDTSKLGFEIHKKYDNISYKDFKKIKLEGGIQKAMEEFYNDYYKLCLRDSLPKLLIVLKTLWIDNVPSPDLKVKKRYEVVKESYQNIYAKIEYYFKQENKYYPLKRIDTIYQLTEQNMHSSEIKFKKNDVSFFVFTLKSLIEKFDFKDLMANANIKKNLGLSSIDSFNKKRFLLPILTSPNLKKGVFMTFEEFTNNSPSVTNYEVNKKGELLLSEDITKGKGYFIFSDDSSLYMSSTKRNGVLKIGNTFEFFTYSDVYLPKTFMGNLLSTIPDNTGTNREVYGENRINSGNGARLQYILVPRQINMETGEIY